MSETSALAPAPELEGSESDVVRRGADGRWRDLTDSGLGPAVRQPA